MALWYDTRKMAREVEAQRAQFANLPPDMREERFREEAEAGWAKIESCVLAFKAGPNILTGGRFDTLSLGTWSAIVTAAGVPSVPMELVGLLDFISVVKNQFAPAPLDISPALLAVPGMVRLDFCGGESIKAWFGFRGAKPLPKAGEAPLGATLKDGVAHFVFDDRTVSGFMNYVGQIEQAGAINVPVWWRPWVKAIDVQNPRPRFMGRDAVDVWPMEWRVIVQGGKIAAISAYYPQAPITASPEVDAILSDVRVNAEQILAFMARNEIQPWHPLYIDEHAEHDVSFVMDFISTQHHGNLFLEAGPSVPVTPDNIPDETAWGAHPCCFIGHRVEGVRLSPPPSIRDGRG